MQQPNQQDPRRRAARPAGSQPRQTRPVALRAGCGGAAGMTGSSSSRP